MLKTVGYLVSTVSVVLLGLVSWQAAKEHEALMLALLAGMATSILGMFLRWCSFLQEKRNRERIEAEAQTALQAAAANDLPRARAAAGRH